MKIIKLSIDEENLFEGVDAVALVAEPAIEIDWQMFNKQEFQTYNDYPQGAIDAAKMGIKRNEELGNKCATQVGKVRAQQLANGENLSIDTIKRMRSFLIRQKDNYDLAIKNKNYDACGYISYLLWGGPDALPWAEKKLKQEGLLELSNEEIIVEEMSILGEVLDGKIVCENCGWDWKILEGGDDVDVCHECGYDNSLVKKNEINEINGDKFFDTLSDDQQELLLKALGKRGCSMESMAADGWEEMSEDKFHNHLYFAITADIDKSSLQDTSEYQVLYQYTGPKDSKNRSFCREILNLNLLFRLEDINNMSLQGANTEFSTYDIFSYKGSYNCRHSWTQKFFKKNKPADLQGRSQKTNTTPFDVIGGPRAQQAVQTNPKSRTLDQILNGVPAGDFTFSAVKDEEMIIAGPLMVPDKLIPRIDEETGEKYYVFFDAEGIKKLAYKMISAKLLDSVNIEHDPERTIDDVTLVETWIIEDKDKDKSTLYGYDLPVGTWMAKYKVNNVRLWNDYIKTGILNGFSVEGIFSNKMIMS